MRRSLVTGSCVIIPTDLGPITSQLNSLLYLNRLFYMGTDLDGLRSVGITLSESLDHREIVPRGFTLLYVT